MLLISIKLRLKNRTFSISCGVEGCKLNNVKIKSMISKTMIWEGDFVINILLSVKYGRQCWSYIYNTYNEYTLEEQ